MKKEELLYARELENNILMAKSGVCFIIVAIVTVLGVPLGFYDRDMTFVAIWCFFMIVLLGIPCFMILCLKINNKYTKYIVMCTMFILLIPCYLLYGYYSMIGLTAPLLYAALYNDIKMLKRMMGIMVVVMVVIHSIIPFITRVMVEPYVTLKKSLLLGCLPRLILLSIMYGIVNIIVKRNLLMIDYILEHNESLRISSTGLEKVLLCSHHMLYAENFRKFLKYVVKAIKDVIGFLNLGRDKIKCVVVMKNIDGKYISLNEKKKNIDKEIVFDGNACTLKNLNFLSVPMKTDEQDGKCEIMDNSILMTFYSRGKLDGLIHIDTQIRSNHPENKTIINMLYNAIKLCMASKYAEEILTESQEELIFSLSEISESKSKETGQHIKRVSEYMRVMGKSICKTKDERSNLACASMLHDVGKLMIPPEILEKPGKLTDEEYEVIKTHTKYGGELLKNVPGEMMEMAYNIATQHHERWDGRGYNKIKEEDIDYYARYVSVIDVFDALISKRCYKDAWTIEDAYDEIVSNSGTQFAPHAVEVFKERFDELVAVYHKYPDAV